MEWCNDLVTTTDFYIYCIVLNFREWQPKTILWLYSSWDLWRTGGIRSRQEWKR